MRRTQFLDLDVLDSPALSVNSPPWALSSAPSSSVAEKIFNDPHSWHDSSDTPVGDREAMIWLAEELEKYGDHPTDDMELRSTTLPSISVFHTQREEVGKDDNRPCLPLPIFEHSGLDLGIDLNIRLSKVWEGSTISSQSHPSPIIFSPPSTGESDKSPITTRTNVPPLDLESVSTPPTSPVVVISASTTWSILELYGVRPNTPDSGCPLIGPRPPSALLPVPPITHPPNLCLITPTRGAKIKNEVALVRPLPVIPDSLQDSPTPRLKTTEPHSRTPSGPALLPCQPSTSSPSPPTMKISSRKVSKAPLIKLSDCKRSKYPGISRQLSGPVGPQLSDSSHSSATTRIETPKLTRFISLPLPSSLLSPPRSVSPSVLSSPHPSRPCSATRSPPPLGPRPRSSTVSSQSQ